MKTNTGQRTVVFILSEVRSGSTWLSYVLGSHPGVAHLGEYHRPFTYPGHVACRLCEAKGLAECEVLHGIENVPKENAYDFAFERFQKPILCDASKATEWTEGFLGHERYQVKVVHLMRDPRGWYASQRRREPMPPEAAAQRWVDANTKIIDFVALHQLSCCTVFYDELTVRPEQYFPPLSGFIGSHYHSDTLEYWNYEHHGLGGNGAAFNVIGKYQRADVTTGDDQFYQARAKKRFHDARWLAQLSHKERRAFEQSSAVRLLLEINDRDFSHFDELLGDSPERMTARGWWRSAVSSMLAGIRR
jgi:hypothetical protein